MAGAWAHRYAPAPCMSLPGTVDVPVRRTPWGNVALVVLIAVVSILAWLWPASLQVLVLRKGR